MAKMIIGVFNDKNNVITAIDELREKEFNPQDFSIVMKDTRTAEDISDETGIDVAGGAISGATTGALLGGLAGLLASVALPGLGAFFIGGPIAAALGLTGAAAATVSGAATGAVAGGLIGALMGLGLTEDEAREYETRISEGAILVAVPAADEDIAFVQEVFEQNDASDVKTIHQSDEVYKVPEANGNYTAHERHYAHAYAGAKGGAAARKSKKTSTKKKSTTSKKKK